MKLQLQSNYVVFLICGNLQQFQQHLQPLVEERDWRGCVLDHLIRSPSLTYLHTKKIVNTLPEDIWHQHHAKYYCLILEMMMMDVRGVVAADWLESQNHPS